MNPLRRSEFADIDWTQRWNGHSTLGRLLRQVDYRNTDGCWIWTGLLGAGTGYGRATLVGKTYNAHRLMFRLYYGEVPEGTQLDHLCRNRACVNPEHLEPVSQRENILRGESPSSAAAAATHCKRGHAKTPENTYVRPGGGGTMCLPCIRLRTARHEVQAAIR